MTRRALHTLFALALAATTTGVAVFPAHAEYYANEKNSKDPNQALYLSLVAELKAIPDLFDCEFAWANMNGPYSVQLEFLPRGHHDLRKWTRLLSITIVMVSGEPAQREFLPNLQSDMMDVFKQGRVIETKSGTDAKGLPTLYVEYEVDAGAVKQHGAAAVMRLRDDFVGTILINSRGAPLAREDATKMQSLALPKEN